jgi:hypothetical protein
MTNAIRTSKFFNYLSALFAFILWGGWAYYINHSHSPDSGITSGIAQGSASFIITLFMVHLVTHLYHKFRRPIAKILMPALVTVSFTSVCLINIHLLVGTPQILYTVLPALSIAFVFCLYTSFKLHKISQINHQNYDK